MTKDRKTKGPNAYGSTSIEVLKNLTAVREPGFTILHDSIFSADQVNSVLSLLRADKDLWYAQVKDKRGREMLIYRGPHP